MNSSYAFPLSDVASDGSRSLYAAAAPENGAPPLLLIHGFLSSRAQWLDNLAGMQAFCRPIIVEHFAHGRTPAPQRPEDCTLDALIDELEQLRKFLRLDSWTVCGHSMGGAVGLNYALAHPDHIAGAIFSNAVTAFRDTRNLDMPAEVEKFAATIEQGGRAALEATPYHPRMMKHVSPRVRDALVEDAAHVDPNGIARALRGTNAEISIRYRIHELRRPALLINGVYEHAFQDDRNWAEQNMPGLRIVDFAEAGHNPNAEKPDEFNRAIQVFMEKLFQ